MHMKLKCLLTIGITATIGVGAVSARTWTSADGSKKFEGELKAFYKDDGKITVIMRNGHSVTFDIAKLSEGDQTFLKENAAGDAAAGGGDNVQEALKAQKVGSKLSSRGLLEKIDGQKFAKYELTKALWDEVFNWATDSARGDNVYQFDNNGTAEGPDHPVVNLNWYDVIKWCNARSEKDNLQPLYYR